MYEGFHFDIADKLSEYLAHIMASLFFSPIIPHAIGFGLLGTFLNYWAAKIALLRFAKMPEMFSDLFIAFFANFMPYTILIWSCGFLYYPARFSYTVTNWREKYDKFEGENGKFQMFDESITYFPIFALFVALVCMFIPIRLCINCVVGEKQEIEPQYNKKYEEVYHQFASYYDKENPITQKKGQLRIIGMQIKEAEAKGDTKALEELRGQ